MRIRSITLGNWLCFEGQHTLDLDAKAYAIVARHVRNPERSNWLGKSGLLEAVRFALTGAHRHRTEDKWITDDASKGGVYLTLDDGTTIERTRKRGQSTRLAVSGATQDEAQRRIYELIGLSEADFLATSYFEQGQMAKFVTQDAADRTRMVTGWFRLEKLIEAEEFHKNELAKLTWNATTLRTSLATTDSLERAELAGFESFEALVAAKDALEQDIAKDRKSLRDLQSDLELSRKAAVNEERKKQFNAICDEGIRLSKSIENVDGEALKEERDKAHDELQTLIGERATAAQEVTQKRKLVLGFNGICPVAAIQCPATADINKRTKQNAKLLDEATKTYEAAVDKEKDAHERFVSADAHAQAYARAEERIDTLREQGKQLREQIDQNLNVTAVDVNESISRLNVRLQDRIGKLAVYQRSIAAIEKSRGERLRLAESLAALETAITTEREARTIVGRNGAQRTVAERGLKAIENGANAMLAESDIDLRVAVQWSREGTSIASACEECGHPFPKSARAKICERCEAPRGMNIINRLEIGLSNVSGAAKDLAGAAFQLSASAWMRVNRGTRWSTAFLDEPFGQLDPANRKAFSAHLATLLRSRYGFEQSFTVAHHASVLDALPGRIEIVGDGRRSSLKVIA